MQMCRKVSETKMFYKKTHM